MKRNPTLQPLSRDHHAALSLGKACQSAALSCNEATVSQTYQRAITAFSKELDPHFQIEEQTLLPLLNTADGLNRNDIDALNNFGKCLTAHVRFEERELFPVIESLL
ncbi:hemerythrin domain-containing protein [Sulfurirhabdus autotrophica]|uniref:Hemerythrin HHE cation binding domain-containing protein n=1 Tax=Sulfurirhabdus autotrophica TaxID=1706046 RepID=A0A4R3YDR3_9PROT|nr:hemerythrin domain-containing protein [Sulfurirhabdus autotrophica]TCV90645.1 hypothetical protein EDC63_101619 [Sulfurirhabdus autotrophica]